MNNILLISSVQLVKANLFQYLTEINPASLDLLRADSVEEAENILFSANISLIIIDWTLEGALTFTSALKADEMFRLLPVLALIPDGEHEKVTEAFLNGVDNYTFTGCCGERLPILIRPLIINNVLNNELLGKISTLQEQAIHDFILLDLIKKYIPKTIWDMANVFAYEQKIHIPEEELELTIAFGDIREFTLMSQHLPAIEVIRNLNSVFEIVTGIVYSHNGDIDKFIGDAFLAVFADPLDAVAAMVQVQNEIEKLNLYRLEQALPRILFRIGVHTGSVIRGNVGGNKRYDNTLIGDTVNTASRLESLSRAGDILISETTRQKAGLDIQPENQFRVRLKGKDSEETVYQVYDLLKDKF